MKLRQVLLCVRNPELADSLGRLLVQTGMRVEHTSSSEDAFQLYLSSTFDIVLLDICLPKLVSWQLLARIRNHGNTPVILLSENHRKEDLLIGLHAGADDYVVEPIDPAEVVARVHLLMQRATHLMQPIAELSVAGSFRIDWMRHQITAVHDRKWIKLDLTPVQFAILACLLRKPGQAVTRSELLEARGDGDSPGRKIDLHISRLRRKLAAVGIQAFIRTVHGVGYSFELGAEKETSHTPQAEYRLLREKVT